MNPIINPMIFYWVDMLNKLGCVSLVIAILFPIGCLISIAFVDMETTDDPTEYTKKHLKKWLIIELIPIFLCIVVPDKDTCYKMLIAQNVTTENLQGAKEEIKDIFDYIVETVKGEDE